MYDSIGRDYGRHRRPDPRIESAIHRALVDLTSIVNVGGGTGSYEPRDRPVVAVEPSTIMIQQRTLASAPVVQASATELPFRDNSFDVALAILTLHHWSDWRRGIREMARVARRRVVILTWDPLEADFWLVNDYFPQIGEIDRQICPEIDSLRQELRDVQVSSVPIPWDCSDGFLGAYWRRPYEYLDPEVRRSISTFSKISDSALEAGIDRLRRDIESGHSLERTQCVGTRPDAASDQRALCIMSGSMTSCCHSLDARSQCPS